MSGQLPSDYEELKQSGEMKILPVINQFEASPFLNRPEVVEYFTGEGITCQATKPLQRGESLNHPVVQSVAAGMGITPAQALLRYGVQKGFSVLCKSKNIDRLAENLEAATLPALSDEAMAALDELTTDASIDKFRNNWEKRRNGTPAPWGEGPYAPRPSNE